MARKRCAGWTGSSRMPKRAQIVPAIIVNVAPCGHAVAIQTAAQARRTRKALTAVTTAIRWSRCRNRGSCSSATMRPPGSDRRRPVARPSVPRGRPGAGPACAAAGARPRRESPRRRGVGRRCRRVAGRGSTILAAHPGADPMQQRPQVKAGVRFLVTEGDQALADSHQHRHQFLRQPLEPTQRGVGLTDRRRIERRDRPQLVQPREGGYQPAQIRPRASPVRRPGEDVTGPAGDVGAPRVQPLQQKRRRRLRQDQRIDQRHAQGAQSDFLDPRQGHVEDRLRRVDRGQPDQAGGVAGQDKGVGARGAVDGTQVDASGEPGSEPERLQLGRARKTDQVDDGDRGADSGTGQAIEALGDGHAGQRLGHDEGRRHGPERPVQVQDQADVERQHGGAEHLEPEDQDLDPGPDGRKQLGKPRRPRPSHGRCREVGVHLISANGAVAIGAPWQRQLGCGHATGTPNAALVPGVSGVLAPTDRGLVSGIAKR